MKNTLTYLVIAIGLITSACSKNDPVQDKPAPTAKATLEPPLKASLNERASKAGILPFKPITGPVTNDFYIIRNLHSQRVLDVKDWNKENGALLQQWDLNLPIDTPLNQIFGIVNISKDLGAIIGSPLNSAAVDIKDHSSANGATIQLWAQNSAANQRWIFTEVRPGLYSITNVENRKALDIKDNSTDNGALVQLWDFTGTDNQLFQLSRAVKDVIMQ